MQYDGGNEAEAVDGIAVIGISCRFPKAEGPDAYWDLLETGTEAISRLDDRALIESGEDRNALSDPDYVRAHGVLDGVDLFDAQFFGMSPGEAALMDPQHRLFLECSWAAFEDAGYDPKDHPGPVGVYAGSGWNSYFIRNVAAHAELLSPGSLQRTLLGNESDTLATRVSYKLGLRGPSMTVQTACSTSLVTVAQACQSLLWNESDMALAGGVSIRTPQAGHLYQEESIFSRSGKCRAFDAGADGTVIGSGAGVVLLKRLEDAVADGDHIHAVIKSAAINNDGSVKAGYAAPSVEGQSAVIREAHALAGVHPETITYVETHGTGTVIGDPIEIAALTDVFRAATDRTGFCAIGSVKTNVGHLDAAAGVAGLIKTVLALRNRKIPASLNFEQPNPAIDFAAGPFYVNTRTTEWSDSAGPRRAGVSSFGIGGTNAHVVLEEAPAVPVVEQGGAQVLPLSARTAAALDQRVGDLRDHLRAGGTGGLADIAHTLQRGRRAFAHRRAVAGGTTDEVITALDALTGAEPAPAFAEGRQAAFLFSGQGPQHVGMARRLYSANPVFRSEADRCFDLLRNTHGLDLRELVYPADESRTEECDAALTETRNAQPALFVLQYSLAKTLEHCGVPMAAGVGHSFGEYAAATLAGSFALEDALSVVVARGRLLQELPAAGAMLAVPLGPDEVEPLLGFDLSIAVVNHPASCVVAGPSDAVTKLRDTLIERGVDATVLRISYASHTPMVEPVLGPFAAQFAGIRLAPPRVPFLSSVTGTWITDEQATDPGYWVTHLRERVRFADGLGHVFRDVDHVLVELGPNEVLTSLARRHPETDRSRIAAPALPRRSVSEPDDVVFLRSVGSLWSSGVDVDWDGVHHGGRRRVSLPSYPFDRQRHWISPPRAAETAGEEFDAAVREGRKETDARIAAADLPRRRAKVELLERLSAAYLADAIAALGARSLGDGPVERSEFLERSQVQPSYRSLLAEWLDELDRLGRLRRDDSGRIASVASWPPEELDDLLIRARRAWAGQPEAELVRRCGAALVDVVRDGADPVHLFTPLLDRAFAEPGEIFGAEYAPVIRRALSGVLGTQRAANGLRVLEIGGGTGITTGQVVEEMADHGGGHRYVFTDISDAFVAHAARRYSEHSWFSTARLDIEQPPDEQGFEGSTFDVVIAANVLHATGELDRTLEHARSLVAPGGLLLLAEITTPTLDFAVSYGLLMGPVADADRTRSAPFLSRERWERKLSTVFESIAALAPEGGVLGHQVFVGRNTGERQNHPASGAQGGRSLRKENDVGKWFRVPSWKRTAAVGRHGGGKPADTWLVLAGSSEVDTEFLRLLRAADQHVVSVRPGTAYRRQDESVFEIDPYAAGDYERVVSELAAQGRSPDRVVYLWGLAESAATPDEDAVPDRWQKWRGLISLATAIDYAGLARSVDLTVVSAGLHDVLGEHTRPDAALLLGPSRVIPLEYPGITSRSVDFAVARDDDARHSRSVARHLADEVFAAPADEVVAYRGAYRWVETVEPLTLDQPDEGAGDGAAVRRGGVYLITGGLGTIGSSIARHLVETVGAKVVLIGRSGRDRDSGGNAPWHDGNPDVLVLTADVTDAKRMQVVVETAESRFGPINGVIHAAGLLGDGAMAGKSAESFAEVLAPKVTGTLVLHELFRHRNPDFMVLFSSLSARKPGFGQAAYAAANCFLDSFPHSELAADHRSVTTINWDVWQGSGMAYDATGPKVLQQLKLADFTHRGILPEQGVDAFRRVLDSGLPQVYVTSSNYLDMLDDRNRDLSQVYLEEVEHHGDQQQRQARPELNTEYTEPRTTTEQMLAEIWRGLLGIERIGANDDFFQLGGDSLLGSQIVTRVRNSLGVHLLSRMIYEHPTIEELAKVVDDALISSAGPEAIAEAIEQVKNGR
ncbi:type I polyketide synthase [Streptomonospora alba]|uniref:type I polyketide synthase n=1 Tax=Streptomonospora alba TaxID=183763 RepID=UPI00069BD4B2|nr:type I polyketide synthase [Streptomonospora alba]